MKKIFLLCILFVCAFFMHAQNKTITGSFIIRDLSDNSKLEFYTKAIEKANFEELRLRNKSLEFKFENGFVLELSPATELKTKGIISNTDIYKEELDKNFQYPVFKISDEGLLVALYNSLPSKYELKINSEK